ncbi:division/cell wall cluster transcriptional repressor MraZ [Miniphocaeibacter massiliensis]|uniref:division/cell wall cluster transcriptional repressor MraZ n=1 Tax=Miniphocaeibacter massiliensis TaxID=2041841 RepID=UPI000C074E94|nr:division/cell wall cluster transcriptional repressor MraZ [Miniphocaeibacter massiliensis]
MFIGEYQHNLDTKGRITLPSKFREELGEEFFITKGMDNCLFVYTQEEWIKMDEKINGLKLSRKEARGIARLFYAGAINVSLDKMGRVLLPQTLRDYAKLKKEAVVIGVSSRIEIWDKESWENYNDDDELNYDILTEKMADIDF